MGNCINRFNQILYSVYVLELNLLQATSRVIFELKYFGIEITGVNGYQKWYGLWSAKIAETLMCIASFIIAVPPCLCISIMKCSDKQADLIYALNILRTFDLSWSFPVFEKRLSKMPASAFPLKKSMIKLMPFLLFFCVGSF